MTYKQYYDLIRDALECSSAEQFIGELGYPDWASDDADRFAEDMKNIYTVAHMSIKKMREETGLTQQKLSERFAIPQRTVENWEARGSCPHYTRLMIADLLGLVKVVRG